MNETPPTAHGPQSYTLDLRQDPVSLTRALVDIPSPSRDERAIADAVEAALAEVVASGGQPFDAATGSTRIERVGNCVVARTERGLPSRVVLAGHLDTVPIADNLPSAVIAEEEDGEQVDKMYGCGTSDMKAGDAVFLHLFAELAQSQELAHDLTIIMYDCEEIEASANGLGALQAVRPDLLDGDLAILGEPTDGLIEAGCQGTLRLRVHARGVRSHSARSWLGDNALHRLAPVFEALARYTPRNVDIDGCTYREGLQAVRVHGGVAGNVVPDTAWVDVNFRFAPDRSPQQALQHAVDALGLEPGARFDPETGSGAEPWSIEAGAPVEDLAEDHLPDDGAGTSSPGTGTAWQLTDMSPGALPGLDNPAAAALVRAAGGQVRAKYGWTDVSRFAAAGVAAVNLGPGDPGMAHKRDEFCRVAEIGRVTGFLREYLTSRGTE